VSRPRLYAAGRARLYAAGTSVAATKTRLEIEALVERHGGAQFYAGWKNDRTAVVGFRAENRIVRLELPMPPKPYSRRDEVEVRRRWRCLLFALKAQFTVVETGIKTFEQAFFADIVTASNQTVYEAAHAAVAAEYQTGRMAGRLLAPAPGDDAEYEAPRGAGR